MLSSFDESGEAGHDGERGALREAELRRFLAERLPDRFGVGTGQLIHPSNLMSRQCDVVVFDKANTPRLISGDGYSLFPVETVLAVIEVKSNLVASELSGAFENLQSAFGVANDPSPYGPSGRWVSGRHYGPPCFVFAYACSRSLEAVAAQVLREWPSRRGRIFQPPPLVTVLGKGVVGPPRPLMTNESMADLVVIRETGDLSLLKFFMHLLGDLSGEDLGIPRLSFNSYLSMPQRFNGHQVWHHVNKWGFSQLSPEYELDSPALDVLLNLMESTPASRLPDVYRDVLGLETGWTTGETEKRTFVFNPKGLRLDNGRGLTNPPPVPAIVVAIDDALFIVADGAFAREDFVRVDREVVELFR